MSDWQSIKTAPNDGTSVLVAWRDGFGWSITSAQFIDAPAHVRSWWSVGGVKVPPTHWMPLPEPPKDAA